jgi:polyisoprenoid-binding protein YceI
VTFNGGTPDPMMGNNYDIGFHATTMIKRSDFGLNTMSWNSFVADDVQLIIEAMFVHQKN